MIVELIYDKFKTGTNLQKYIT